MELQSPGARAFQVYLKMKFKDLRSAKRWLVEWRDMGQQFREGKYKGRLLSVREMCSHASLVIDPQYHDKVSGIEHTTHGAELERFLQSKTNQ